MHKPKESDWKRYRTLKIQLRDRYIEERTAQLGAFMTDPQRPPTERFWDALEEMKQEAQLLRDCLDNVSRARMEDSIMMMCSFGMMRREDMEGFSEELVRDMERYLTIGEQRRRQRSKLQGA